MVDGPSNKEGLHRTVVFDAQVFGVQSVKEAAYRYCDRVSANIEVEGSEIVCQLTAIRPILVDAFDDLVTDFRIEVLDCDLRSTLRQETEPLRNFVLSLAFSKASLGE